MVCRYKVMFDRTVSNCVTIQEVKRSEKTEFENKGNEDGWFLYFAALTGNLFC